VGSVLSNYPATAGPLTVETLRPHQGRFLVTFAGYADRDMADQLRGVLLCVDSSTVPDPDDPDEFNDHQLVGLRAELPTGEHLGEVVRIDHAPASDLLIVRLPDGRTGLVPFVRAIVPEVDIPGGKVVLTPPDGLFDV
jgi:16S rRNA processing protein RimM